MALSTRAEDRTLGPIRNLHRFLDQLIKNNGAQKYLQSIVAPFYCRPQQEQQYHGMNSNQPPTSLETEDPCSYLDHQTASPLGCKPQLEPQAVLESSGA